jgi:hypothetical protein
VLLTTNAPSAAVGVDLREARCRFPFNLSFLNFQLAKDTFNMSPNRSRLGSSGPALTVRLQSLDAQ